MFKRWFKKTGESDPKKETTIHTIETPIHSNWVEELSQSNDFVNDHTSINKNEPFWISYYRTLVNSEILHRDVLPYLEGHTSIYELKSRIPIQQIVVTSDAKQIKEMLLRGFAAIRINEQDQECLLLNIANTKFNRVSRSK